MKTACGWILMILGTIPGMIWFFYAGYLFYIGPKIGWISDRFFDIEGTSLIWCALMFAGMPFVAIGCELSRKTQ
jgi:hypothetical protein